MRQEVQERLRHHQTFGFSVEPLHPPSEYLRKRSRSAVAAVNPIQRDHNHFEVRLKAPLDDHGGRIVHHQVNHLKENIRRAESAKPRRRVNFSHPKVDNHRGHFFELDRSGLVPKYVLQAKFGRVPQYLHERKKEAELRAQEEQERIRRSSPKPKLISEAERAELLRVRGKDTISGTY